MSLSAALGFLSLSLCVSHTIENSVHNMNTLIPTSLCNTKITKFRFTPTLRNSLSHAQARTKSFKIHASSSEVDAQTVEEPKEETQAEPTEASKSSTAAPVALDKDLKKVGTCLFSTGWT